MVKKSKQMPISIEDLARLNKRSDSNVTFVSGGTIDTNKTRDPQSVEIIATTDGEVWLLPNNNESAINLTQVALSDEQLDCINRIPSILSDSVPLIDGQASSGNDNTAARADHCHPTDISRAEVQHTHDANDIVSGQISANRVPSLDSSKIASGVLTTARIPDMDAAKITSGVLTTARIPNMDVSKITSGVLSKERLPIKHYTKNLYNRSFPNITVPAGQTRRVTFVNTTDISSEIATFKHTVVAMSVYPYYIQALPLDISYTCLYTGETEGGSMHVMIVNGSSSSYTLTSSNFDVWIDAWIMPE
jgi:hypothetical protein